MRVREHRSICLVTRTLVAKFWKLTFACLITVAFGAHYDMV
jgi:hypothetical protein